MTIAQLMDSKKSRTNLKGRRHDQIILQQDVEKVRQSTGSTDEVSRTRRTRCRSGHGICGLPGRVCVGPIESSRDRSECRRLAAHCPKGWHPRTLRGKGSVPLYEFDVLKTELDDQAELLVDGAIQVYVNGGTEVMVLSRWEKFRPLTKSFRVKKGELLVKIAEGPKPLEVETPVASARVKQNGIRYQGKEDGETTLRVMEGVVEFGTAFGTCPIQTGTISFGVRGKKCTKPKEEDHHAALDWAKELTKK